MSAAQYVRDAALTRLARAGLDGQLAEEATTAAPTDRRAAASARNVDVRSESDAVWAQARLARERAHALRINAVATQARIGSRARAR